MVVQRVRHLKRLSAILSITLLLLFWTASPANTSPPLQPLSAGPPPTMISCQGIVQVGGFNYTGTGYFKFAIIDGSTSDGTTNYWANDGTTSGEPDAAVALPVSNGLFNVLLGDTSIGGSMQAIEYTVFGETDTWLRIWFSENLAGPFEALEPNQRLVSVPYALQAEFAQTPAGPTGPTGPTGPPGPPLTFYTRVMTTTGDSASVHCDPGDQVTGGGYRTEIDVNGFKIYYSGPLPLDTPPTYWRVERVANTGGQLVVYAVCADVTQ